jgi:hypothetical protein
MKMKVEFLCEKDLKDMSFDCKEGKLYYIMYDTDFKFFDHAVNEHLVKRLNQGYLKIVAPWRYLPKHREFVSEIYPKITKLTEYCEEFYKKLEEEQCK